MSCGAGRTTFGSHLAFGNLKHVKPVWSRCFLTRYREEAEPADRTFVDLGYPEIHLMRAARLGVRELRMVAKPRH